ncbi:hypothetical protein PHMEG_00029664 [Phytophthora megakarya]|uniref:Reverse transcriptase n=1 Tax=Phytophthora megakarya TaxID=4795 RepID=A0A225V1Y5_9STRA|nr:hypothetical protein PHMEG_00029664 [Phytophthora megakarya]
MEISFVKLSGMPPALVEPLKVTPVDDAVLFRCKPRMYAPLQIAFLRDYTAQLEMRDFICKNYVANGLQKHRSKTEFRITIDYRTVNKLTVAIAGAMPNLAVATPTVKGAVCFAKLDMIKGFWQLPLDVDRRELIYFMTEDTVYTPTRWLRYSRIQDFARLSGNL